MMRRILVWLAVGFALGTFASMWFGPEIVTWWATAPTAQSAISCESQIRWATTSLVKIQLIAGGGLALIFAIFITIWSRRRPARPAATDSAPATPPASPR